MSVQEIRDLIGRAQEVAHKSAGVYLRFQQDYVTRKGQIFRKYKPDEAAKVSEYFAGVKKRELMLSLREQKREYTEALTKAKQMTERLIYAKVPKVDAEKQGRFDKRLVELRTELLLANPKTARDKLATFIQSIDEPALAVKVRDIFPELITPILQAAGSEAATYRNQLLGLFETVKTSTLPEEAQEAVVLLETSDFLLNSRVIGLQTELSIREHFGPRVSSYVNSPDDYFALNPDDDAPVKPEETAFIFEDPMARVPAHRPQTTQTSYSARNSGRSSGMNIIPPSPFD
ncbi:hypothetical protein [Paenibacillus sp. SI8]|uniref:hypothetical protein n=1 Tax=unclassified Paenibacillus TaxID=185978 RepID=UPI0034655C72